MGLLYELKLLTESVLSFAALDHVISVSETGNFLEFVQGALVLPVVEEVLASAVSFQLLGI